VKNIILILSNICILNAPEVVNVSKLILVNIGHGEGDTIWNGWAWYSKVFIFLLLNLYTILLLI